MARQMVRPGGTIETVTPDELVRLIPRAPARKRIRVAASLQLTAAGATNQPAQVYQVPAGMTVEVRRLVLTLTGAAPSDPNTGNVLLNAAGKFVALTRDGLLVEYLQPAYGAAIQVPGAQTWSREQGPEFAQKESIEIAAAGLTANLMLAVYLEGFLEDRTGHDHL